MKREHSKPTQPLRRKPLWRIVRDALLDLFCAPSKHQRPLHKLFEWQDKPNRLMPLDPAWPPELLDRFRMSNELTQNAYVFSIPGISILDGRSGFAASNLGVIRESMPYDSDALLPRPTLLLRSILPSGHNIVEHALSLHDPYELNYFHFFNDVLGKLLLVRERTPDARIETVIISRALHGQPWFQRAMQIPLLSGLKWRIQEPYETLHCRDLVVAKSPPHHKPYFDRIVDSAHALVEGQTSPHSHRLLLLRETAVRNQRIPSNQHALRERLAPLGFDALDPATMPWEEQVLALRDCSILVGAHGAGMTNLMFRGHEPLHVIEIFPPDKMPPHYYWLASLFGHAYTPIVAPISFVVDVDQVLKAVNHVLSSQT